MIVVVIGDVEGINLHTEYTYGKGVSVRATKAQEIESMSVKNLTKFLMTHAGP